MSPKQLGGKEADARSDIFAFRLVLYEMISGKCAFEAPSEARLMAAILHQEPPPSETRLKERLSAGAWNLLYFAGHAECRAGLNHTSIALESSSGEARNLSGKCFAGILAACPTLRTVMLQAGDSASFCFDLIAKELLDEGVSAVVMLPALTASASGAVIARLYATLLDKSPLDLLERQLRAAHPEVQALRVLTQQAASASVNAPFVELPKATPAAAAVSAPPVENRAVSELQWKRAGNFFDVFLCHNSSDKRR